MPSLPGINHKQAIKAFEKAGFWLARQGKHITMTNGEQIITIPRANPIVEQLKLELRAESAFTNIFMIVPANGIEQLNSM